MNADGSSPLSRGIHWLVYGAIMCTRIIPALAGNTTWTLSAPLVVRDHPRSRGEYRTRNPSGGFVSGSSPLSRGLLKGTW